jgi:hypothetical protein
MLRKGECEVVLRGIPSAHALFFQSQMLLSNQHENIPSNLSQLRHFDLGKQHYLDIRSGRIVLILSFFI